MRVSTIPAGVVIAHSEAFAGVNFNNNVAFNSLSYNITPSNPTMFPWLASIANSYEFYRFRSLRFRYVTRSSTASIGTFALAIDYDPTDLKPSSFTDFMSIYGAKSSSIWNSFEVNAQDRGLQGPFVKRYTGSPNLPTSDPARYSVGSLFTGITTSLTAGVGDLFVDYEIELSYPQAPVDVYASVGRNDTVAELSSTQPFGTNSISQLGGPTVTWNPTTGYYTVSGLIAGAEYLLDVYSKVVGASATHTFTSPDGTAGFSGNSFGSYGGSSVETSFTFIPTNGIITLACSLAGTLSSWVTAKWAFTKVPRNTGIFLA